MQRCLRGTPARGICRICIHAVFDDVVIDRRKFHGDELANFLVNHVKLVFVIGGDDFAFELGKFAENPAVEAGKLGIGYGMFRGIEIVKV